MRVRMVLVMDVDTDDWSTAYGQEGATEIRQDVRSYVRTLVSTSNPALELVDDQ